MNATSEAVRLCDAKSLAEFKLYISKGFWAITILPNLICHPPCQMLHPHCTITALHHINLVNFPITAGMHANSKDLRHKDAYLQGVIAEDDSEPHIYHQSKPVVLAQIDRHKDVVL